MDGRKGEKSLLLTLGLEQISGGVGEAVPFVLDCYTGQLSIGIKEVVGYNWLELRTRYKFRELSTY